MIDSSYLYCNLLEPEALLQWLQWLKQYLIDMEDPLLMMAFRGQPVYYVQLPTHNQPIPAAEWKVEELPIDRPLGLDIISVRFLLFTIGIKPQENHILVWVYGRNVSAPNYVQEHEKLRRRLEYDIPPTKEMREVWAKQIQEAAETQKSREKLKSKLRMRIKTGLIRWASEQVSRPEDYMCGKKDLPALNTYSKYKKLQLIYTDEDIAALGTTWKDLYSAWDRNKLDALISELLLGKPTE